MSAPSKFASSQEAKKNGWFSRRHESREAHEGAKAAREAKIMAKRQSAEERARAVATYKLAWRARHLSFDAKQARLMAKQS